MNIVFYFVLIFPKIAFSAAQTAEKLLQLRTGKTVTLSTGITGLREKDDVIAWSFGEPPTRIAYMNILILRTYYSERFRDRLQLDSLTGSLTITHLNTGDSGLYQLLVISEQTFSSRFHLSVYESVSAPHIQLATESRGPVQSEEWPCYLECSVEKDTDVTLSWYRGEERLTQTSSLQPPHSHLTLPLVVVSENINNSYSCVSENPVSNQSRPVDLQTLCALPAGSGFDLIVVLISVFVIGGLALVTGLFVWRTHKGK